jgi:hypothetical protein
MSIRPPNMNYQKLTQQKKIAFLATATTGLIVAFALVFVGLVKLGMGAC